MRTSMGRIGVGIAALALTLALAAPAAGGRARATAVVHVARGHIHLKIWHCAETGCTESENVTVAPGGAEGAMTDAIPANATQASVSVVPKCTGAADRARAQAASCETSFQDDVDSFIGGTPSLARLHLGQKAKRLLACVFIAGYAAKYHVVNTNTSSEFGDTETRGIAAAVVFLQCIQALLEINSFAARDLPSADQSPAANPAAAACRRVVKTITDQFTRTRRGYTGAVRGATKTSSQRLPVSISCRHSGPGLVFTIKPTRRGTKLPQVFGPNVGIGLVNGGQAATTVTTTFKVN